jgi:hypothetical protein
MPVADEAMTPGAVGRIAYRARRSFEIRCGLGLR